MGKIESVPRQGGRNHLSFLASGRVLRLFDDVLSREGQGPAKRVFAGSRQQDLRATRPAPGSGFR